MTNAAPIQPSSQRVGAGSAGPKLILTAHQLRAVAVAACCDPRTVCARIEGKRVRSTSEARIDAALRSMGFAA